LSNQPDFDFVKAAGALVWRKTKRGWKILAVHRARYDDWSLPKGKLEAGETWQVAAEREVTEETGLEVAFLNLAGVTTYYHGRRPKVVLFWNTIVPGETDPGQIGAEESPEVDEMQWLNAVQAAERLSYPDEQDLVAENWPE
jgi:8-oxo-dGTP diphosphatase